jgi:beta-lactamase regulating signal transducer with metallopeptidase domain
MNASGLPITAQLILERVLNSLPEGLVIVLFAWLLLRVLKRQNSGTRFAVWFLTLLAVVALPFLNTLQAHSTPALIPHSSLAQFTLTAFEAALIFAVWILVSGIAVFRLALGLWQIALIRRNCTEIDPAHLDPEIQKIMQQDGAAREVCLATSEQVRVPVAIGFFKPAIVLPVWMMQELPTQELAAVVVHERTHLQRWDDWTNLFQKIARAVFFFHPAVWWIDARLSLEREMACDDAVLAATGSPRAYASCLIEMLEKSCERRGWTMAQAAVQRAKELSLRLTQILDEKRPATTRIWKPALTMAGAFSLAGLLISPYAPQLVAFRQPTSLASMREENLPHIHKLTKQDPETAMGAAIVPASFSLQVPSRPQKQSLKPEPSAIKHGSASPSPHIATHTKHEEQMAPRMIAAKAVKPAEHSTPTVFLVETTFEFSQTETGNNPRRVQASEACVTEVDANGWRMQVCNVVVIEPAQAALADSILQDSI